MYSYGLRTPSKLQASKALFTATPNPFAESRELSLVLGFT
jgi:hypothetical protein